MSATAISAEPGIHRGLSFAEYAAMPLPSASTIEWARIDALHLKAALEGKLRREDTSALSFGRALHLRLLEPDSYKQQVWVSEPCRAILKSGENKGQACRASGVSPGPDGGWLCGKHLGDDSLIPHGVEVVSRAEAQNIESAAEALRNHPGERLRKHRGEFEVAMIADIMGVRLKARLDKWIPDPPAIIDIKKVAAATSPTRSTGTPDGFEKLIASYGYGFRAALYLDIAKALTGKDHRWFWIVVEDGEPFSVGVYEASQDDIDAGRNEYAGFLHTLKSCRASGIWPGFSDSVVTINGPKWWRDMYTGGHS